MEGLLVKGEVGGGSMKSPARPQWGDPQGTPHRAGFQGQATHREQSPRALVSWRSFWVEKAVGRSPSRVLPSPPQVDPTATALPLPPRGHQGALTFLPHQALLDVADVSEEIAHCGDL